MLSNYEKISDIGKGKFQAIFQANAWKINLRQFDHEFKSWLHFSSLLPLGSFGRVSKVRRKADGRILVWKELDYGKMNDKEKQ